MPKLPSGRTVVCIGTGTAVIAIAWLVAGKALHGGRFGFAEQSSAAGFTLLTGVMVHIIGLFRRAAEAERRLAVRRFSWCVTCGHPFHERCEDSATVACPECGSAFCAGEDREWYRIRSEWMRKQG